MKNKYSILLLPILLISFSSCSFDNGVDLRPDSVKEYLSSKNTKQEIEAISFYGGTNDSYQNLRIDFDAKNSSSYYFTITIASDKNFSKNVVSYETYRGHHEGNFCLLPNQTHYYKVTDTDGKILKSGSIKVKDTPGLPLSIDERINNVRDIGGWKTKSGKKVKYGMIYRGTRLNNFNDDSLLTETAKTIMDDVLNLKSELDIRWDNDNKGQTKNMWNENDTYIRIPLYQYTFMIPDSPLIENRVRGYYKESKETLKQIFDFLSDESNYPIYVHCNGGADRTGTFAYLVNGLLGVSYKDLTRDFELTSFCGSGNRLRSALLMDENYNLYFDDTGVMQNDSNNYVAWDLMHNYMQTLYGENKNNEQYAITNFLKNEIGISTEQIDKIKSILLN